MKKEWNAPSMQEMNINETANGIFGCEIETVILFNDSKKSNTPTDDPS